MAALSESGGGAPYGPWSAFVTFLRELAGTTVPPVIDNSLFRSKSGTAAYELRGALKFFGLMEGEDNRTTPRLREIVAASSDKESLKAKLTEVLPVVYGKIIEGVDLQTGTRQQLEAAFREQGGLSGSANRKALRFFLNAMSEAGIPLSPHFGAERMRPAAAQNGTKRSAKPRPKKVATNAPEDVVETAGEERTERIACSIPGGRTVQVLVPAKLTAAEENFLVKYLTQYFELKRGTTAESNESKRPPTKPGEAEDR